MRGGARGGGGWPEGRIPADNPDPGSPVWTLGHRNVQGLAWDAQGRMFATEFGQNRVDEINRIEKGANYGWPEVEGTGGEGRFRDPLVTQSAGRVSASRSRALELWQARRMRAGHTRPAL